MKMSRGVKAVGLVSALLVSTVLTSVSVFADMGVVNADVLNFREGQSTVSRIIGKIPNGKVVDILDKSNKNWYKISYDNKTGFVSSEFLDINSSNYGTGTVNATRLNVRKSPSTSADIIGKLDNKEKVIVTSKDGGWYKINFEGQTAYISAEYIVMDSAKNNQTSENSVKAGDVYKVTVNALNLRESPSTSSKILGKVTLNEKVSIVEATNKSWYKIKTSAGKVAYVSTDYIKFTTEKMDSKPASNSNTTNNNTTTNRGDTSETKPSVSNSSSTADNIISYAKTFLGVKYVWGGSSPSGFDCSGFTSYVFKKYGYNISRTSKAQATNGTSVNKANLEKGDLVFFSSSRGSSAIGHVGIYIGGGSFIHASSGSGYCVKISSLSEPFYVDTYKTARRIIK